MESKASRELSPEYTSDPEENDELSEEDEDDDRNHKHRRREQSSERDPAEQPVLQRTHRKRNRPFENGNGEPQSSETWKNHNNSRFEKRRAGVGAPFRSNQMVSGGNHGRGRGRELGFFNNRDSRIGPMDIASQMVPHGSITPGLFAGRGRASVSSSQGGPWNGFGLIPGIPNVGLDNHAIHPMGMQGTFRPTLNPSLNMGIPAPMCRDFEERGFCLRGDMCPMSHGVNRIVVEDVQSLSQFNLPVSLPSAPVVGPLVGPGGLPSMGAPSATLLNSKGGRSTSRKNGLLDDGLGLNGAYPGSAGAGAADLYDPDQPLWNNNGPEASSALPALHSPKFDETESLVGADPHDLKVHESADTVFHTGGSGIMSSEGTNLTVSGGSRIGKLKNRLGGKDKAETAGNSEHLENEIRGDQNALANLQGASRQGRLVISEDPRSNFDRSSMKSQKEALHNMRKPSQKALRTVFVNGIPLKNNKREAILSHFQKFGEVIDIYIPANNERAFVQFSKREEAEAALNSPDAVMGNRFIKLWWANRDNIPDDGTSTSSGLSLAPRRMMGSSVSSHPSAASGRKDNPQSTAPKGLAAPSSAAPVPGADSPKLGQINGPKSIPLLHKKMENMEQLKEQIRKKQEQLDQKRNDLKRQLHNFAKQATRVKSETISEPSGTGTVADVAKAATPSSSDIGAAGAHTYSESVDEKKSLENVVSSCYKPNASRTTNEPSGPKQLRRPLSVGSPFLLNRYKLDNRPKIIRILPPLPAGLTTVTALKEHFSPCGEVSSVELEDVEPGDDCGDGSKVLKGCSARVGFATRHSAERAFLNGRCWQGNDLQFKWVTITTNASNNDNGGGEIVVPPKSISQTDSHEASGANGELENSGKSTGPGPLDDLHAASQSSSTSVSSEKKSPNCESMGDEPCPTSTASAEEGSTVDSVPTGMTVGIESAEAEDNAH